MIYHIPKGETLEINTIVLDLNGTLTVKGILENSTIELIKQLQNNSFRLVLISGDIRGNAKTIAKKLGMDLYLGSTSDEKAAQMQQFDKNKTAAIGNARIDIGTFENAVLSIATLQSEGIHTAIINHVDIIVPSIDDALRLFIDKKSLEGTLRA
jgi:P-type E1-E2 ATPase